MVARLACLVALGLCLIPTPACCCACCDGEVQRSPLAWSASGDQLLVHYVGRTGCQALHAVEIWPRGEDAPSGCFDLLGDPSVVVLCDQLTDHYAGENKALTPLPIGDFVLPPSHPVPAASSPLPVRIDIRQDRTVDAPGIGTVELELDGSWVPLHVGPVTRADADPPDNSGPIARPVTVSLWESPDGRHAVVVIRDNWVRPDWISTVVWVELPAVRGRSTPGTANDR